MGYSKFSGPVYGAKALLASWAASAVASTGASTALVCSFIVPAGEDWFPTEIGASCSTCSSGGNLLTVKSEGGSTASALRDWGGGSNSTKAQTLGTATWGTSTGGPVIGVFTASAGEMEGVWTPTGSTVRVVLSVAATAVGNLNVNLHGYRRFVSSTRAE